MFLYSQMLLQCILFTARDFVYIRMCPLVPIDLNVVFC